MADEPGKPPASPTQPTSPGGPDTPIKLPESPGEPGKLSGSNEAGVPRLPHEVAEATEDELRLWMKILDEQAKPAKPDEAVKPAAAEDEHEANVQRWWLRYSVAGVVVLMLWTELIGIFLLLLLQGLNIHLHIPWMQWLEISFHLNDWLFGAVISGVFVQTIWSFHAVATHLFPDGAAKAEAIAKGTKGG